MNVEQGVNSLRAERWRHPVLNDVAYAVLRAFRSLLVIVAVVLLVAVIRDGGVDGPKLMRLVVHNRTLFILVFLGLCVWEFWYRRAKRHHAAGRADIS